MIDQTVTSRPRPSNWLIMLVATGLGLLIWAALTNNVHLAIFALLPWTAAFALWWVRPQAFSFRLTPEGIETDLPEQLIAYDEIEGVRAYGVANPPARDLRKRFAISVFHRQGRFEVPARLDAPSADLFHFLWERLRKSGSREVNRKLLPYLETQESTFGSEKVFTFHSRQRQDAPTPTYEWLAVCLAMLATAAVWIGLGLTGGKAYDGWLAGGIALGIAGVIFCTAGWAARRSIRVSKELSDASIVISPLGLAMVQGDLRGEIRWEEIKNIKIGNSAWSSFYLSSTTTRADVTLCVEGAEIPILDIYDRPIAVLREIIESYHE